MKIIQVTLRNKENHYMTCWLEKNKYLEVGKVISLRDYKPTEKWEIRVIYDKVHNAHDFDFHRKWDNNNYDKHKGLKI